MIQVSIHLCQSIYIYISDFPNQDSDIDQHDNIVFDDDLDCPISMSELKNAVLVQNNNKSCGTYLNTPLKVLPLCYLNYLTGSLRLVNIQVPGVLES